LLRASVVIGSLLADGIGDAILVRGEHGAGQSLRLAYNICRRRAAVRSRPITSRARAADARVQSSTVTARIKARTEHLKGVKIAIMGCIVNGPGEMADADFGYVAARRTRSTSTSAKPPSNSTSPKPKRWTAWWI
jgi:(E)-4-hydroxy-3-methylbut-2-enyl-diphosphate synthase